MDCPIPRACLWVSPPRWLTPEKLEPWQYGHPTSQCRQLGFCLLPMFNEISSQSDVNTNQKMALGLVILVKTNNSCLLLAEKAWCWAHPGLPTSAHRHTYGAAVWVHLHIRTITSTPHSLWLRCPGLDLCHQAHPRLPTYSHSRPVWPAAGEEYSLTDLLLHQPCALQNCSKHPHHSPLGHVNTTMLQMRT